jgi:osmoprotectant transport system substrate-binding protein
MTPTKEPQVTDRKWPRLLAIMLAVALALTLAACGDDDDEGGGGDATSEQAAERPGEGKPAVTMGAKNFTEQYILGELYTQALQARGYTVRLKSNIGSSEITDKALTSGQLDLYPEYTGVILTELAGQKRRPSDPDEAYEQAKRFQEDRGYTLLEKTPFADSDAIAVKPGFAQENDLETVADLADVDGGFSLGAPPEFRTRFSGLVGMREEYGISDVDFRPLSIGLQYRALDSGRVDAANVFTTDGQLQEGSYVVLEDPKFIFGFQNVAPVVSQKVLDEQGPEFAETLNGVSEKLTTEAMQRMNAAVDIDKRKPADVAKAFLQANGLV